MSYGVTPHGMPTITPERMLQIVRAFAPKGFKEPYTTEAYLEDKLDSPEAIARSMAPLIEDYEKGWGDEADYVTGLLVGMDRSNAVNPAWAAKREAIVWNLFRIGVYYPWPDWLPDQPPQPPPPGPAAQRHARELDKPSVEHCWAIIRHVGVPAFFHYMEPSTRVEDLDMEYDPSSDEWWVAAIKMKEEYLAISSGNDPNDSWFHVVKNLLHAAVHRFGMDPGEVADRLAYAKAFERNL